MGAKSYRIGEASEHLVMADLLMRGYDVLRAPVGARYDLLLHVGQAYLKVQVKGSITHKAKVGNQTSCYRFYLQTKKRGMKVSYSRDEVDLFALCAVDLGEVAYLSSRIECEEISLYRSGTVTQSNKRSRFFDELTLEKAIESVMDEGFE